MLQSAWHTHWKKYLCRHRRESGCSTPATLMCYWQVLTSWEKFLGSPKAVSKHGYSNTERASKGRSKPSWRLSVELGSHRTLALRLQLRQLPRARLQLHEIRRRR